LGGAGFGYANQLMVTVAGLWLTPLLLARTGQHDYGLWLVGTQVLAYLMLMDFGVVALLPRETAYAAGRAAAGGTGGELPRLVGQTARLVLWQTPLVAAAAFALWAVMPAEWEPLRLPLCVILVSLVLTFPLRICGAVLQGLQDLEFLAEAQAAVWLVSTGLTVALVFAGWGLYALAAGWVAGQLLSAAVTFWRLRRLCPEALPRRLARLPWESARARLASGFWMSVNQVAVVLLVGTDVLVVGKLLGPEWVVPYACTAKLVQALANQPQMLMQLAMPALSELRARGERERLGRVCVALGQAMLLLSGAVVCVVLALNRGFVGWWVGAGQYGGALLTALVLLVMLLRHLNLTVGYLLFAFGLERRLAVTAVLDGLLTVGAGVALTARLGLVGAPLGAALGVCLVSLPGNLSALARVGVVPVKVFLRALAPWGWRFAALALASAALSRAFVPDTFTELAAVGALVALAYALVMLQVARRDPLGVYVRPLPSALARRVARAFGAGGGGPRKSGGEAPPLVAAAEE
jgi:O-antigen/teichoic acid export membrane protein